MTTPCDMNHTVSLAEKTPKETAPETTTMGSTDTKTSVEEGLQQRGIARQVESGRKDEECGPLQHILSTRQLVVLFAVVWGFNFALALSFDIFDVLTPYVTSAFGKHALTATTSVVASVTSGIVKLPYAKLLDVWGRPQCMAAMVLSITIGTIMMAACRNVETYCAAQVFYFVGFFGIQFSFTILIADAVPFRHRTLFIGVISTPSILSIWAYGPAGESILKTIGYRWGFGCWAILIPISSTPLLFLMFKYDKQARKAGLIKRPVAKKTMRESAIHYCKEFDVVGLTMLGSGLCLLLLAISIYSYQSDGWKSPMIISFIVVGFLLLAGFLIYEKYLAPATFLPWQLIKEPTVVFTNLSVASLYISLSLVSAYVYSMLIVAFNQSVTHATYINNIDMVGSSIANVLLGVVVRYNGRIKYYALFLGIPLFVVGEGLMISLHIPNPSLGLMVFCQILIAFGSGIMYPILQLTLMAISHTHTPALLAVQTTLVACGDGTGSAIATAIWTWMFRKKLAAYLPSSEIANLDVIYEDLKAQSSYAVGSGARTAIDRAYGETQRVIFITATSILAVTWISVLFWRDIDVRKPISRRKAKGAIA